MIEKHTTSATILTASNGSTAFFSEHGTPGHPDDQANCLWISGSWPLAEFDNLVEFVTENKAKQKDPNQGDMKLSELEASDEIQTDG